MDTLKEMEKDEAQRGEQAVSSGEGRAGPGRRGSGFQAQSLGSILPSALLLLGDAGRTHGPFPQ